MKKLIDFLIKAAFYLLVLAICSMLFNCITMLSVGFEEEIFFNIMWCTFMASAFIFYFSLVVLVVAMVYLKYHKEAIWPRIRKIVFAIIVLFASVGLLAWANHYAYLQKYPDTYLNRHYLSD